MIIVRSCQAVRRQEGIDPAADVQNLISPLPGIGLDKVEIGRVELAEVEAEWKKLGSDQRKLVRRIYVAGELSWQQIDEEYKKRLLPIYVGEPTLLDYLLERSTLLECDTARGVWGLKYSEGNFFLPNPTWKIKPNLREAVGEMIQREETAYAASSQHVGSMPSS